MTKIFLAIGLSLAAFFNVNAQHNHAQHGAATPPQSTSAASAKDKSPDEQIQALYIHYLGIKDALVADDQSKAASHANQFSQTASLISYRHLSEGNVNALRKDASAIADARDIAAQRKSFSNLSNNMAALAEKCKLSDKPVYQQYCPMAKAYWLSNEKEIKNPYYGSSMLTCGSVKKTF
ncbi:DUF3347 domain-containing protein [Haoranjiania flava]|uniref:DUF3347 domain-containing protein n=1 Tax=Haoranjiania flava TaxID=1856322 RepID=A0AAE3IRE3_9BACT|nr:DUF3347 domain-containing protein [Haoranjiania flava]MCU7694397.1 DUF3347 domain-containing protein [Haoranjiania flava]